MSRKANTFAGCTIPEISKPQPNISPQIKAAMRIIAQPANTCRVNATTTIAVEMKMVVATIERTESRAIPQMP